MMKKILFCLAGALAITNAPALANQTHYYYNETKYPIKIETTYTRPVRTQQTQKLISCMPTKITVHAPSAHNPEPWAMRRVGSGCAIAKIEVMVTKDGKEIPATPLVYSLGFQGTNEFTIREIPEGSNQFAVLEYKE